MPVQTRSQSNATIYKYFKIANSSYKPIIDEFYEWADIDVNSIESMIRERDTKYYLKVDPCEEEISDKDVRLIDDFNAGKMQFFSEEAKQILRKEYNMAGCRLLRATSAKASSIKNRSERCDYIETMIIPLHIKFNLIFKAYDKLMRIWCKKMFLFSIGGGLEGAFLSFALCRPELVSDMCYPFMDGGYKSRDNIHKIDVYSDLLVKYGKYLTH